jgi:hypothetical protein
LEGIFDLARKEAIWIEARGFAAHWWRKKRRRGARCTGSGAPALALASAVSGRQFLVSCVVAGRHTKRPLLSLSSILSPPRRILMIWIGL